MSDCRKGGRGTYAVPKPVEQATIKRMCREFGKPPWTYPVDKPECWPDEAVELVGAIEFGGVRYERVRECENASSYAGEFKCSECGAEWRTEDMDLIEPTLWVDGVADYPSYCQHCGARVKEGGDD